MLQEDHNDPAFKTFRRTGDRFQHLETKMSLSLSESLIGCVVKIDGHPGYDEGLFVQIPAGSFHNDRYCLRGFGMPLAGNIGTYGDLFVQIEISISSMDRSLFMQASPHLLPVFKERIRVTECAEDVIQKEAFLV